MLAMREMRAFLKARRARLRPSDVGLRAGNGTRRTPGLRRAEVAQLAGISEAWYTKFEMGQERALTARVVGPVAKALRLTEVERCYLSDLVNWSARDTAQTSLALPLEWGIGTVTDVVLVAYDRWMTALKWNAGANAFLGLDSEDRRFHNKLSALFLVPQMRAIFGPRWERHARLLLGVFRRNLGRDPNNTDAWRVVEGLQSAPDFGRLWKEHEVHALEEIMDADGTEPIFLTHSRFGSFEGVGAVLELPGSGGGHVWMIAPRDGVGVRLLRTATSLQLAGGALAGAHSWVAARATS